MTAPVELQGVRLAGRTGQADGTLRVADTGLAWRQAGGAGSVEVAAKDVHSLTWTTTPRGACLAVGRAPPSDPGAPPLAGPQFVGLSAAARETVTAAARAWGVPVTDAGAAAVAGANWGALALDGGDLVFSDGGGAVGFRLPLADVTSVGATRDDVALELAPDDGDDGALGGGRDDALVGVTFAVPRGATVAGVDASAAPAAALADAARARSAAAAGAGAPAATFDQVAVLAPRGRFDVALHAGHMKLSGTAQDYRVPYTSIARALVLPRPHAPSTLVAVQLDPPLRKGATTYPFLLLQFPEGDGDEESVDIALPPDVLAAKNEACGGRLPPRLTGAPADVFSKALRGLAGTKLAKPGAFRADGGDACGVRASFKSDDGYLFPLDRALFYAPKPPTLVPYDDVASIEFVRRGGGVLSASQKTFDLAVRVKSGDGGAAHSELVFRGIARSEWSNLFAFLQSRHIVIDNLRDAAAGAGGGGAGAGGDRGAPDAGLARLDAGGGADDDDESDEDFAAGSESSDGDDSGSDSDDDGGGDSAPAPAPKKKKQAPASGATPPKKRAKKDPNAPKGASSAYIYFCNEKRAEVKEAHPDWNLGEVGKELGALWKATTDRSKWDALAAADTARYKKEMEAYKAKQAADAAAAAGGGEGGDVKEEGGE